MAQWWAISLYLVAIVIANLAVAAYGQLALPATALLLVPLDLITRDVLHERWERTGFLWWKMTVLILTGSVLTVMVSSGALRVALGSSVGFMSAGLVNTVAYWAMAGTGRWIRMNSSNFLAAWADSVMFPIIAFDVVSVPLVVAQALAKFSGGMMFSGVYCWWRIKKDPCRPEGRQG